jgi:transaldolase
VAPELRNRLGIAIGRRTYRAYRELLTSPRWRRLVAAGARAQRLVWVDTSTEDEKLPASWYVQALVAPETIDRMSERTLIAFAAHGRLQGATAADAGSAEACLARFARAGIDVDALALQLQVDGVAESTRRWEHLLVRVAEIGAAAQALRPVN